MAGAADPITYSLVVGPGAVSAEGQFSWTPLAGDEGMHVVKVRATDDEGGAGETVFLVTRTPAGSPDESGCRSSTSSGGEPWFLVVLVVSLSRRRRRARAASV